MNDIADEFGSGIPYVEPPIAQLRLSPPVRLTESPAGNFDASNFGFVCLQRVRYSFFVLASLIIWFTSEHLRGSDV
jgi:carboxylesterase type B